VGESLGLSNSFAQCIINQETRAEVEQDMQDGLHVGVQGTPTFIVNGEFLVGAQSEMAFKSMFEKMGLAID